MNEKKNEKTHMLKLSYSFLFAHCGGKTVAPEWIDLCKTHEARGAAKLAFFQNCVGKELSPKMIDLCITTASEIEKMDAFIIGTEVIDMIENEYELKKKNGPIV
jgi:hypothetical protein